MTAERSTKPVSEKLGVKAGERAVAVNAPLNVQMALGKAFITQTGAPRTGEFDLGLYFATDKTLLGKDLPQMTAALKPDGRLWQGVSLVAIDDIWAAMRFKPAK